MNATGDLAPPARGEAAAPDGVDPRGPAGAYVPEASEQAEAADRSLLEDLHALYEDGKSYASAELAFQKTRASFAAGKAKTVAIFGGAGALLGLLALIGLTVGLIIALAPEIGPWGATALVVGVLLIVAALCVWVAARGWREMMGAFGSGGKGNA